MDISRIAQVECHSNIENIAWGRITVKVDFLLRRQNWGIINFHCWLNLTCGQKRVVNFFAPLFEHWWKSHPQDVIWPWCMVKMDQYGIMKRRGDRDHAWLVLCSHVRHYCGIEFTMKRNCRKNENKKNKMVFQWAKQSNRYILICIKLLTSHPARRSHQPNYVLEHLLDCLCPSGVRIVYNTTQRRFLPEGRLRAARVAYWNTSRTPSLVLAEHSR